MTLPHDAVDRLHELPPGRPFAGEHLPALRGEPKEAAAPLAGPLLPAAFDESAALEPDEHRIERRDAQIQLAARALLDALADVVAVPRSRLEQGQDQELRAAFLEFATEHRHPRFE